MVFTYYSISHKPHDALTINLLEANIIMLYKVAMTKVVSAHEQMQCYSGADI